MIEVRICSGHIGYSMKLASELRDSLIGIEPIGSHGMMFRLDFRLFLENMVSCGFVRKLIKKHITTVLGHRVRLYPVFGSDGTEISYIRFWSQDWVSGITMIWNNKKPGLDEMDSQEFVDFKDMLYDKN